MGLFAEGINGVLMNEFPLDAAIASFWRIKSDAQFFYDSDSYQRQLMVMRKDFSRSFAMLLPIFDERSAFNKAQAAKMKKEIAIKDARAEHHYHPQIKGR